MERALYDLTGQDALRFLQGIVTNDVLPLAQGPGLVWCALLTPQGKYLADFFLARTETGLILDFPAALAAAAVQRLTLYRLRADVQIAPSSQAFAQGLGPPPPGALPDPRHPDLGWRAYGAAARGQPALDPALWAARRVALAVPEAGSELVPDDSFILEFGFERLRGVNFKKGCYVGQEVTARMKHKTELRKGLARVAIQGQAAPGTPITSGDGRVVGRLGTQAGPHALAYLRADWAQAEKGELRADSAVISMP